jgi:hypothetical protein
MNTTQNEPKIDTQTNPEKFMTRIPYHNDNIPDVHFLE